MNTVEALNVLGKALCGDSFEVKPGLTDAETILEIAKNYSGSGGESGGGESPIVDIVLGEWDESGAAMVTSHTWEELGQLEQQSALFVLRGQPFFAPGVYQFSYASPDVRTAYSVVADPSTTIRKVTATFQNAPEGGVVVEVVMNE